MDALTAIRATNDQARVVREALNQVMKDTYMEAITLTLGAVTRATWQDSSNAAYNWHVLADGDGYPAYEKRYGFAPVGAHGEKRSINKKDVDMKLVGAEVILREMPVIRRFFTQRVPPKQLRFFNSVEVSEDHPYYALNAEIYGTLHHPEVAVTFNKTSASGFAKWQSKYRF